MLLTIVILIVIGAIILFLWNSNTVKAPENFLEEFIKVFSQEELSNNINYKQIVCPDVKDNILASNQSKNSFKTGTILTKDYKIYYYDTESLTEGKNCVLIDSMGKTYNKMIGSDLISDDNLVSAFYDPKYNFGVGVLDKEDIRLSILNENSNDCIFTTNETGVVTKFACSDKVYDYENYKESIFTLPEGENVIFLDDKLIVSNKNVYLRMITNAEKCEVNIDIKCEYEYNINQNLINLFKYINYYSSSIMQDSNGKLYANTYNLE